MAMSMEQFKARLLEVFPESQSKTVPPDEIERIRREYPGIPEDYLQYLGQVGWGDRGMGFMVYSGPCPSSDIYDETTAAGLRGVVVVGDNFSGEVVGYDTNTNWQLGEIGSSCEFAPLYGGIDSFVEMVCERFLTDG